MNYLYSYAAKVRPLIDWGVDTKETIEDFEKQWTQGNLLCVFEWPRQFELRAVYNKLFRTVSRVDWRQLGNENNWSTFRS